MILLFNRGRNSISAQGGLHDNLGLFFRIMQKLSEAPFLWWSEILRVEVDFEDNCVILIIGHKDRLTQAIPFQDLLALTHLELIQKHMRPLSAALARLRLLPNSAEAIETGASVEVIGRIVREELIHGDADNEALALTNLLYDRAELPWDDVDFAKVQIPRQE